MKKLFLGILGLLLSFNLFAEEKYLNCVLEQLTVKGVHNMETKNVNKYNEPLFKISNGSFTMFIGNPYSLDLFKDGIEKVEIGKPKKIGDIAYSWKHIAYKNIKGTTLHTPVSYTMFRERLTLISEETTVFKALGGKKQLTRKFHECKFITIEQVNSYLREMKERNLAMHSEYEKGKIESNKKNKI